MQGFLTSVTLGPMSELRKPLPESPRRVWATLHLWQIQFVRDAILIALLVGLVMLGYTLRTVTVPMLLAIALAYLFEPVVRRVTRDGRISRPVAAATLILLAIVLVILPVTLAAGFGLVQGAKYAQMLSTNIQNTIASVQDPTSEEARLALPRRGWLPIRNYIVEQRTKSLGPGKKGALRAPDPTELPLAANPSDTLLGKTEPDAEPATEPNAGTEPSGETAPPSPEAAGTGVFAERGETATIGGSGVAGESAQAQTSEPGVSSDGSSDLYQLVLLVGNWLEANSAAIGRRALSAGGGAVDAAVTTLGSIFKFAFAAFLTAFFFFFFCNRFARMMAFWNSLIPHKKRSRVVDLLGQMDEVVAGFVRGRLTICAMLIAYYCVAYWMIGVPAALLIGLGVGLLTLVPYAAGAAIPVVMVLMWLDASTGTFRDAWWWVIGAPCAVLAIQQFLDDYVMTPRIQGKTTNMDTPTILFASIAGGVLAGFYGLLLAIPVAACIKILLKEVFWPRVREWIQGRVEDPLPIASGPPKA